MKYIACFIAGLMVAGIMYEPFPVASKKESLLHICYPNGIYDSTAAPECPQFRARLMVQLNRGDQ